MNSQKRRSSLLIFLFLLSLAVGFGASGHRRLFKPVANSVDPAERQRVLGAYGQLPLRFEANRGQMAAPVKFVSRNAGHTLFLTANEAVLELRNEKPLANSPAEQPNNPSISNPESAIVRMKLVGANAQSKAIALDELSGKSNYFIGDDPSRWRTNVANFARVKYDEVYPGIDLIWHGNQRQLEHDFLVSAGANPNRIRLTFTGAQTIQINKAGDLILQTETGELKLQKPVAWQETDGQRQLVDCQFALDGKQQVGFRLGDYDHSRELVIDPVLLYSTYLGGSRNEQGFGVAVDKDFNAYIVGHTFSPDFPGSSQIQSSIGSTGTPDAFVLKINPSGADVLYGTYLGGSRGEAALGIAVDKDGNAHVAGYTFSTNFPKTIGAIQESNKGSFDGFVAKLNSTGSALIYSSYIGGGSYDTLSAIALDTTGNAYLSGITQSSNLPATGIQQNRGSQSVFKSSDRAATWTPISGKLDSTQILSLTIDPINSAVIYAGAEQGVFKSSDGGQSWQQTGQISPATVPLFAKAIAVDPSNPNRIFVAASTTGIYRSTDGGQTYQDNAGISFGNSPPSCNDVVIDPTNPAIMYLASLSGVFKSTDGGNTWIAINNGLVVQSNVLPAVNRIAIDPSNPQVLYAATPIKIFKTVNGGAAWVQVGNGLGLGTSVNVTSLVIDPTLPSTLYAGVFGFEGLYKTTDGGTTWRASNTGLNQRIVRSLAIDPLNSQIVYAGTDFSGVYKSLDGGASWNSSSVGMPNLTTNAITIDRANPTNVYVGVSSGADAFVAKINSTGSALVWLTYLGGTSNDGAGAVAVDRSGNCYLIGVTNSIDFPTLSSFQPVIGGLSDAFVAKINPAGTALVYSTYFGGRLSETGRGIAVNDAGQAFITGSTFSDDLPVKNPLKPSHGGFGNDAFVAKFNASGSALEYSTWLGGSGDDDGYAIAVDGAGNAYVTGNTLSSNFPLVDAPQTQLRLADAFVAKLNATGTSLAYSTFLGGNGAETGNAIAVDSLGNAYVVGDTNSPNFPTSNPLQPAIRGGGDAFITKLGNDAELAITKTVSRNPVMVGNNFSFALTVTNNGPSPATGVIATDALPAGINFVSATSSQGSCSNNAGTVTCNIGNLAVRASATITLTVSAIATGSITNTASVKANEPDGNAANNQASASVTVSSQPSVYGRITLANGNPLADVAINMTGALSANQRTNAQGRFQFANLLPSGNYTITPTSSAYSFEPAVRDFNLVTSDQSGDFVATLCAYSLSATSQSFEANGGNGVFNITAPPRCPWAITTDAAWIKITSPLSGAGNASISFAIEPTAVPRSGRISVGGQTFNVLQGVSSCVQPKRYFYPLMPRFLTTGDLNGDGYSDLLIGPTFSAGTTSSPIYPIGVLFGDANGQLAPGAPILAKLQPVEIATGDFNGDGKVDVVSIPFSFAGEAEIFLNNGSGGFGNGVSVPLILPNFAGFNPKLRAADLNKDGKADLFVAAGPAILVALSNSSGNNVSFSAPIEFMSSRYEYLSLADVNGDGASDLLMANRADTDNLAVFINNGTGVFGQPVVSTGASSIFSTDLADFNGDGKVDLVTLTNAALPVRAFMAAIQPGDGSGKFGAPVNSESFALGSFIGNSQIAVGDVNGDGKPDVLVVASKRSVALQGNGAGGFGSPVEFAKFDEDMASVAVANFEGDKRAEIAIADFATRNVVVLSNRCSIAGLTVSGRVVDLLTTGGVGGVTMKLTGARTASTVTDSGGNYSFIGLPPGNYTLTPERAGSEITPASRSFNLTTSQVIDFDGNRKATAVSAASYSGQKIAQGSIVALFGLDMTNQTQVATRQPLPTSLGGMTVAFKNIDNAREYNAQLFFVSPSQINLLVPLSLSDGEATFRIFAPGSSVEPTTIGRVMVDQVAPGLFSADASGRGLAAAVVLRVRANGSQVYEPVARFDTAQNRFVAVPIDLSNPAEQVFLLAFGTGISGRLATSNFLAKVGGEPAEIAFVGAQSDFAGLDQLNLRLPRVLAGRGNVDVLLTIDGKAANTVQINIR